MFKNSNTQTALKDEDSADKVRRTRAFSLRINRCGSRATAHGTESKLISQNCFQCHFPTGLLNAWLNLMSYICHCTNDFLPVRLLKSPQEQIYFNVTLSGSPHMWQYFFVIFLIYIYIYISYTLRILWNDINVSKMKANLSNVAIV